MNRTEYRETRRMVRENGLYALKWMSAEEQNVAHAIFCPPEDPLEVRVHLFVVMGWSAHLAASIARDIADARPLARIPF
ncbi:hypothetical protein KDX23_23395 [Burkholderia vietnamiensis]|uniref:hypothetical protein n=1 Tax=Burkholderia vietnamiensis TaxID=60552 RepID=UPI001B9398F6|nr:hypothetical protein [Burkholderia vietnamiensis]MBR8085687.1 hypothetical protein [Burkholderia vietnamiensis]